ncbi:Monothiol glutaredoxin-4 [Astathelohania contejeani]|uniref:Monothiol glutaredoxin-4 n=1 Tax=Astathelohania contejeani TaxID=164912 RepID=A0ABQ7HZK1_9MICR|nr:Monothiol glutaredoxin-4 [Thelohania contejeani]
MKKNLSQENILNQTFKELEKYDNIIAYDVESEDLTKLCQAMSAEYMMLDLRVSNELKDKFLKYYNVTSLPCIISYNVIIYNDENFEKNMGLASKKKKESIYRKINSIINKDGVTLFIKGTPERPECGYTRQLIELLNKYNFIDGRNYNYFNIFMDNDIREELKIINQWPTFPQIYIKGIFEGGLDILKQMDKEGILENKLKGK